MTAEPRTSAWTPYATIVKTRLREFTRRPEAVFWVYFFPLLMVIVLGTAFRNKRVETVALDLADSPGAAAVQSILEQAGNVRVSLRPQEECQRRLRGGQSDLYLVANGSQIDSVDYHFDPTRPGSLTVKAVVDRALQVAKGRTDPLPTTDHEVTEPGSRYIDFLVPGLLGMGLMGGGLWGVGSSRLFFMVPEIILLIIFSRWLFDVRVYGSYLALFFLVILGAFVFSGIGLLVASRARTIETVSGLMNLVMLPMWTLSGVFFSSDNFPAAAQPFIKLLPLTALNDALRAVMTRGESIWAQGQELTVLAVWGLVCFFAALKIFRWND
ncbi:MAG: ABC transporter permease [Blastopirellula sp.]|nr:ABC transporter permease [Blastopirellula sp.]